MDVCASCGRPFLRGLGGLELVELEDRWGVWHEWDCSACIIEAVVSCAEGEGPLVRVTLYGFTLGDVG